MEKLKKMLLTRLLPETLQIHSENNPGFNGKSPEPIHRNLIELSELIKTTKNIDCGLAYRW